MLPWPGNKYPQGIRALGFFRISKPLNINNMNLLNKRVKESRTHQKGRVVKEHPVSQSVDIKPDQGDDPFPKEIIGRGINEVTVITTLEVVGEGILNIFYSLWGRLLLSFIGLVASYMLSDVLWPDSVLWDYLIFGWLLSLAGHFLFILYYAIRNSAKGNPKQNVK